MVQVTTPGTISGSVDVTDRAGRLLGKPNAIGALAGRFSIAGNASNSSAVDRRIKSAIITTNATVANRSIQVGGFPVSSKVVAASQTNADLLDREVAVPPNEAITIANGQAGDVLNMTLETGP